MTKNRNITLEDRIDLTMSPHLFKDIKTECHICRSGRKRNLRPLIYYINGKFEAIFECERCKLTGGTSNDLGRPSYRYRDSEQMKGVWCERFKDEKDE